MFEQIAFMHTEFSRIPTAVSQLITELSRSIGPNKNKFAQKLSGRKRFVFDNKLLQ